MLRLGCEIKGVDALKRAVANLEKQTRFAASVALNRTAQSIARAEERETLSAFDKPTRFTQRAFGVTRATPAKLTATVFIRPKQAEYLAPQITGGGRPIKRMEAAFSSDTHAPGSYWVPGPGIKLNASGNMTLAQVRALAQGIKRSGRYGEVVVGVPHPGMAFGLYARKRGAGKRGKVGLVPLLLQARAPRYQKRFDFFGVASKVFDAEYARQFSEALDKALRTARW